MNQHSNDHGVSRQADTHPRYGPAGAWADLPDFRPSVPPRPDQVADGRRIWLADSQFDLTGPEIVWLNRRVIEVVNADGLQDAALFSADFDPAFERVVIHHVRVIRDGRIRVYDPRQAIQVIRREPDLERAKYDGRLTAHFTIPDIRVGDIIDVARSHLGQHPVLGGRLAAEWVFNWGCWVGETRVRVLAPEGRRFATRSWNNPPAAVERHLAGGVLERTWRAVDTAPARGEPGAVAWAKALATVQFADVMTWADVANTFRPLYRLPDRLPADLEREVQAIAGRASDPADRTVQALRLVQGGLRYQSVTLGAGGFTPNPVDRIWASRTGDCKDASLLLTAILRALGVRADPALVNTWNGWARQEALPSLVASDHCIVRAEVAGKPYWLDPTAFPQGGRLDAMHQWRSGWALPLVENADLEFMGEDPVEEVFDCQETYDLGPAPDSPATLTVRTTYRSWRADDMRRRLESGRAALVEDFRTYFARRFGGAALLGEIEVDDDLDANRLSTVERYEITGIWTADQESDVVRFDTPDDLFAPTLNVGWLDHRSLPVDLGLPRTLRTETIIKLGKPISVKGWNRTFEMPGVRATSVHSAETADGSVTKLLRVVTVDRRTIPPEDARRLQALREEAFNASGVSVSRRVRSGQFVDAEPAAPFQPRRSSDSDTSAFTTIRIIVFALLVLGALSRCVAAAPT
ncbi:MAG: DUF3857 domain-containing protein [Caulobacterales bacterium]|nr:DUF3857 domain-containing protein [Caulobacterales bacterium]